MDLPIKHVLNIELDGSFSLKDDLKIIFLCGVVFDSKSDKDKRRVLKRHLDKVSEHRTIILEEYFSNPRVYGDIDLSNLHDVETLVACFANATVIIHESISTAAELGMLASNKSTASKLLIIHPDSNSIEENKISKFIELAYYRGQNSVLSKQQAIAFNPVIQKKYESNDRYVYHTTFPSNLVIESRARNSIDDFIKSTDTQPLKKLLFRKAPYSRPTPHRPEIIDYFEKKGVLHLYISPMSLRGFLFSLLSIDNIREEIEKANSVSTIMSLLETKLDELLLSTSSLYFGIRTDKIKVNLKGVELSTFQDTSTRNLRKAIGLFVYLLKAMGYLSEKDNRHFKFTRNFTQLKHKLSDATKLEKKTSFNAHLQKESEE